MTTTPPILLLQGSADTTVFPFLTDKLYQRARRPRRPGHLHDLPGRRPRRDPGGGRGRGAGVLRDSGCRRSDSPEGPDVGASPPEDDRRLRLRRGDLHRCAARRRRRPPARRPPAPRRARYRVRMGQLEAAADGPGGGRIDYEHHPELAPTTELRRLQYADDERAGVGKRNRDRARARVCPALHRGGPRRGRPRAIVTASLPIGHASALLCVERDPEACHRSLIAERLEATGRVEVEHLRPG